MHARLHHRKDQLRLRSLRDLRSRWVFAPVRPRLARWEYKQPKGPQKTTGNGDISEARFMLCIVPTLMKNLPQRLEFFFAETSLPKHPVPPTAGA